MYLKVVFLFIYFVLFFRFVFKSTSLGSLPETSMLEGYKTEKTRTSRQKSKLGST